MIRTRQLLAAERRERIFFGFDEVWFLQDSKVRPKPKHVYLISPAKLTPKSQYRICAWMELNRCSLGLGDGIGANFIAKLRGIAKYLLSQRLESSQVEISDSASELANRCK